MSGRGVPRVGANGRGGTGAFMITILVLVTAMSAAAIGLTIHSLTMTNMREDNRKEGDIFLKQQIDQVNNVLQTLGANVSSTCFFSLTPGVYGAGTNHATITVDSCGGISAVSEASTALVPDPSGTYGTGSAVPVITVDEFGRVTNVSTMPIVAVTAVTAGAGLTGGTITTSGTISLQSGVIASQTQPYATVTVDQYGRVTALSPGTDYGPQISDLETAIQTLNMTAVQDVQAGQGINVSSSAMGGVVTIDNLGVITINSITASPVGELFLTGASGITISPTMLPHELVVNASVLNTAISNNQMTISTILNDISNINTINNNQQLEINALINAVNMLGNLLNGTQDDFNMTITELVMDVMMLQQEVNQLQTELTNVTSGSSPTGTMVPWAGTAANVPAGYLLCDGAMVDNSTYSDLFTVIGCQFCPSQMCTGSQFCLPDMRGRVPVGQTSSGEFAVPLGTNVGQEEVILTVAQMPGHGHSMSGVITTSGSDHQHTFMSDTASADANPPAGEQPAPALAGAFAGKRNDGYPAHEPVTTLPKCGNFIFGSDYCDGRTGSFFGGSTQTWPTKNAGEHTHGIDDFFAVPNGGSMPHSNIQPSKVTAGYIIKF